MKKIKPNSFVVVGLGLVLIGMGSYFKHGRVTPMPAAGDVSPVGESRMAPQSAPVAPMSAKTAASAPSFSIRGSEFEAIVADTPLAREHGLSDRQGLEKNQAMVFIFDQPDFVGFWMKDMLFSIDMLFLDANMRVISSARNVSPDTYPEAFYPEAPAKYVVELSAGTLDRLKVAKGDIAEFRP